MQRIFSNILQIENIYFIDIHQSLACGRFRLTRRQDDCEYVCLMVLAHKHDLRFINVMHREQNVAIIGFLFQRTFPQVQYLASKQIDAFQRFE